MDVVLADLHADESSDDLTDDGSWAEQGRQEGQRADEAKDDEPDAVAGQWDEKFGEPGTESGGVDDADEHGYEPHEGDDGGQHGLYCVSSGLVEHRDDLAGAQADLVHDGLVLLLGDGFGNLLVSAPFPLDGACCSGF